MPLGRFLSNEDKTKNDAFMECGIGLRNIGHSIKLSVIVIGNYIKLGQNYGKWMKGKGKTKVTR